MTGYGRGEIDAPEGHFTAELRSVNSRHLEARVFLPPFLAPLENEVRTLLKRHILRAKLDCRIRFTPAPGQASQLRFNEAALESSLRQLEEIRDRLGLAEDRVTLDLLLRLPGATEDIADEADLEAYWPGVRQAVEAALERYQAEREREGAALGEHIREELGLLRERREALAARAGEVVEKFRERLRARLQELADEIGTQADPGRLEMEVALFADRSDVSEELVRLAAHLDRLQALLDKPKGSSGKPLEFLLQEIHREVNTTSSKLRDTDMVEHTLEMKAAIERIREQIQNLE